MTRNSAQDEPESSRRWTVPNVLCAIRLAGAPGLVVLAVAERPAAFLILFLVLTATDWIDGKLAVWLEQRSSFGARLDSIADAAMYSGLLFGTLWMKQGVLLQERLWIAGAVLSYAVSCAASAVKFRKLPSYHLRTAKGAWLLVLVAAVSLFLEYAVWPLRIAMSGVMIANLEGLLATLLFPEWRADVGSVLKIIRRKEREET